MLPTAMEAQVKSDNDQLPQFMEWMDLHSLVGSISTRSLVARPTTVDQCREALAYCREHGLSVCTRGAGRTYGDLALNDGHALLDMSGMNKILDFDEAAKTVTVEAGARIIDIFEVVHYKNLYVAASPTESHSSVAGAICANVNGKEAWRQGSFAEQVVRLSMMLANGEIIEIDRDHELFYAAVGSIGMLGVILDATIKLTSIPSPYLEIHRIPASNVDELLEGMQEIEKTQDACVVWVDAYAKGKKQGRAVIHCAKWIERDETEAERKEYLDKGYERLDHHRTFGLKLHDKFGPMLSWMLQAQKPMLHVFNRLYYQMARLLYAIGKDSNQEMFLRFAFEASFTVPPAHLVCGPNGYTVQLTFPRERAKEAMLEILEICRTSACPPVTTILRAHKKDDCLISFSEDGYSLNFEFHPKRRHIEAGRKMVDQLVDAVVKYGGKIHLAKDQVLKPEQFYRIYPQYKDLLAVKAKLDPDGMFTSDLARRVGIDPTFLKERAQAAS